MPQPHAKLTDEEQYQVCQWYGEFKSPTQIQTLIKQHFGKTLDLKNVWQYAHGNQMKKWKPLIERLRQEWALGVMDIPLAHKRARLEKLVSLYNRADRNEKVDEFHKIKQCVDILAEMRTEMEAGKSEFTNVYMTTIHTYSDEEILKQRDRILERLKQIRRNDGSGGKTVEVVAEPAGLPSGDSGRGGVHIGSHEVVEVDSTDHHGDQHPSSDASMDTASVRGVGPSLREAGPEQSASVALERPSKDGSVDSPGDAAVPHREEGPG